MAVGAHYSCVCVCCHPIYSGRQTCGRTSRARVTQEEGQTGFLRLPSAVLASFFIVGRIQSFLSLVDREVKFCIPTNQSFSTCWGLCEENPSTCDCVEIRTHVPTSEGFEVCRLNHPGDRLCMVTHIARAWINRVRPPIILHVVS